MSWEDIQFRAQSDTSRSLVPVMRYFLWDTSRSETANEYRCAVNLQCGAEGGLETRPKIRIQEQLRTRQATEGSGRNSDKKYLTTSLTTLHYADAALKTRVFQRVPAPEAHQGQCLMVSSCPASCGPG